MQHPVLKHIALSFAVVVGFGSVIALVPSASVSAANSTATNTCVYREFRKGSKGSKCIGDLQRMLNKANSAGLAVDNDYGPRTTAAVTAWQKKVNNTYDTTIYVDGITGIQTWAWLCLQRAAYPTIAKRVGCDRWNDEISNYLRLYGNPAAKATTVAAKKKATKTKTCDQQTFSRSGSKRNHECVDYLQNMLNMATGSRLDTTAPYGSATRTAVKAFQTNTHVKGDSRGAVGVNTWAALCHYQLATAGDQKVYNSLKEKVGCGV